MSRTEKDWEKDQEEEAAKQEDITEVTKDELTDYLQYKMYIYIEIHNQLDYILWESFQGDFKDFTVNIFTQIPLYQLQQLYNYLNIRGV